MATLFDELGGEPALRAIFRDFYDRVFSDMMIGFMFQSSDKERLIEKETELTARMLGGSHVRYTGMPMRTVHAPHRVMGGQFARRQHLLRQTLDDHDVPPHIRDAWLAHNDALRPQITHDPTSHCGEGTPPE